MYFSLRILGWGSLIAASSAVPTALHDFDARAPEATSTPIPPSLDPFYTAPRGFKNAAPGAVLNIRAAPGNLTTIFNASSEAYNILYRTTDSHYQPAWAVTTLFVPLKPPHNASNALLSYQVPYNTVDVDASPSFLAYAGAEALGLQFSDINTALNHGWFVNVPDFEGPLASFGASVSEGHATLDSVRAALSSHKSLDSSSRYAMWGYSGGSVASEFAAELQVQYAPELNFAGMAIGGLVPNFTSNFDKINNTPAAGLLVAILLGVSTQYPDTSHYLDSRLKTRGQYNATGFFEARNLSAFELFPTYADQDIFADYFAAGTTVQAPAIQKAIDREGLMGYHGVPQMPIFLYKATQDEYSAVADTDASWTGCASAGRTSSTRGTPWGITSTNPTTEMPGRWTG
ncbi:hypothetical protein CLAIMM_08677 [Cladophialophora immunda]|nr:hypothetical protein CLAIMM_08677 [Cladophialophora immunda]